MYFHSWAFLSLFAVSLLLFHTVLRGSRMARQGMLLVASYLFYGWWDWRFLSLIAFSTMVDYIAGMAIESARGRDDTRTAKRWLLTSIICNLSLLGFFKYFNFFRDNATVVIEAFGFDASWFTLNVLLPVGISFYTFQSMAYTIDVFRGHTAACRNLVTFSLYVSFFPQLVAGPIERSNHLIPELDNPKPVSGNMIQTALFLILLGYFKKLVIADPISPIINETFSNPTAMTGPELLFSVYISIIYIYADFSGYSDIARGVARLFGIELVRNFEQPLLSYSVTEFWRRWHISLMSWFRDYVFIPLGGSRCSVGRVYFNLMAVMVISGVWHGAGWNWFLLGAVNGVFMSIERFFMLKKKAKGLPDAPQSLRENIYRTLVQFHLFGVSSIIYINGDLVKMGQSFAGVVSQWGSWVPRAESLFTWVVVYGGVMLFIDLWQRRTGVHEFVFRMRPFWGGLIIGLMLVATIFWSDTPGEPFFYFQF